MVLRFSLILVLIIAGLAFSGCGSEQAVAPPVKSSVKTTAGSTHKMMGYYQFTIIPEQKTIEAVPIRTGNFHLNLVSFLEPPAGLNLAVDQVVDFTPGLLTVDIAITNPYQWLEYAVGFDVCGIVITHGSETYPLFTNLHYPGGDDVRLNNPDGFTRWWNPVEFPVNDQVAHKSYVDGLLGTPHSVASYDAELNPYKYFATEIQNPDDGLDVLDPANRGALLPGTTCVRRYEIAYNPGNLVFNYVIDASWTAPDFSNPPVSLDDFPVTANRPEAYRIEIHNINNTLKWNESMQQASGKLSMSVYVWDWQNPGDNLVCAYSNDDQVLQVCSFFPTGGTSQYSIYDFDLPPTQLSTADDFLMWIQVDSKTMGYDGFIDFELQNVYFPEMISVEAE
ncbi:MAG TPA: hypothetical protein VGB30_09850 [bacterium]|jgi:hypothetical protein